MNVLCALFTYLQSSSLHQHRFALVYFCIFHFILFQFDLRCSCYSQGGQREAIVSAWELIGNIGIHFEEGKKTNENSVERMHNE